MKKKGIIIYSLLCIAVLLIVCRINVSNLRSECFLENKAIETTLMATNDLEEADNNYSITGEDAYLIFALNEETGCLNFQLNFAEELNADISIQVFYADDNGGFSENNSFLITGEKGNDNLTAALPCKNVRYIRIDLNGEEGDTFSITGLRIVERNIQTVFETFFSDTAESLQTVVICIVFLSLIYFGLYFSLKYKENPNVSEMLLMLSGWLGAVFFVYIFVWFHLYTISPSNLMYAVKPWNSSGVSIGGPYLSDAIDSNLPEIYSAYYGDGFSFWKNTNVFGTSAGVEIYLNPFNWFYFLPLKYAILFKSVFEFSMAYFGMCYLLKRMKLCISARISGGIAYALSSAMVMWHFWAHTDVMMLAPLALALGDKLIRERKSKDMFLLALVVFLMFIAGMPTYAAYIFYLLSAYMLIITICYYKKKITVIIQVYLKYAVSVLLGVLAAFPYLQTLLGTVGSNGYAESRAELARDSLSTEYLRTLFLPYYRESMTSHINESTIYVGITMILLLLFVFIRWKKKGHWFWSFSLLILALLCFTHIFDELYVHLPMINSSSKIRLISLLVLVAVVLASICYDDIIKHTREYKKIKWRWCVYLVYAFLQIYISVCYWEDCIWARWSLLGGACSLAVIECIILLCKKKNVIKGMQCILYGIVIVNMGIFARLYFPTIESGAEIIPEATDSIQYLQKNIDDQRMYTLDNWTFLPNTNVYYGLNNIAGHSFVNTNDDITDYLAAIDDEMAVTSTAYHGSKIDNYNLLKWGGVKYIVVNDDYDKMEITDAELVYSGSDGLDIYEIDQYNERFFLSENVISVGSEKKELALMEDTYIPDTAYIVGEDPCESTVDLKAGDQITILSDETDKITLEVETTETRILVFNEYNDGNWKVYIDGEEQDMLKVNYLFNGVEVASGTHTVEFVYDVHETVAFCIISIIDIGIVLGGIVFCLFAERRKSNKNTALQE